MASIMLRRVASSSLLFPRRSLLAVRSAAAADVDSSLVVPLSRRFSTSICSDLVRKLEVERDCAEKRIAHLRKNMTFVAPPGFPFRIEKINESKRVLTLSRRYGEDETIQCEAHFQDHVGIFVKVSKDSCNSHLQFGVVGYYPDRFEIRYLLLKKDIWGFDDRQRFSEFGELNEETKKGWYEYLDMRGMNLDTTNSLMAAWDPLRKSFGYEKWLNNLKKFMADG